MNVSFVVVYLIFNVVLVLSIKNLMETFFEERRSSAYMVWLSYLLLYILPAITFFMWNIPLINIVSPLLLIFVVTLNYKSNMIKRLLVAPIFVSLALIASTFGSVVNAQTSALVLIQVAGVVEQAVPFIFLPNGIVIYALGFFAKKFLNHIKKDTLHSPIYLGSYLIVSFISVAIIYLTADHPYLPYFVIAIIIAAILGINVLALFFLDRLSLAFENGLESALYAQEKEYYFTQSQLMQESIKKVRAIRHDMNFHLSTLKDFAADEKAVTDYINGLIGNIDESEMYSNTGNIAFDSIINYKLRNAKEDKIKLDLSVVVPPVLNIEIADIVIILGNLLDNALDAVEKVEDKLIWLDIDFSKSTLYIKVDNTFDGKVEYTDSKSITTRKSGDEHGHGLRNIRKSVEKYNGHIDITHDDGIFSVGVLLYVADV